MRILLFVLVFLLGSAANAQQCTQCLSADACIRDYTRSTTKIKADYRKGAADQRKEREQTLRDRFSPRAAVTSPEEFEQAIRVEIDKLKDCLSKTK
jgi:hypothetical protein